jgi:hypothetical protein
MYDAAMIISFIGFLGIPFWAKYSARAVVGSKQATPIQIVTVVLLSLVVMSIFHVLPWFLMMSWAGTANHNLTDPSFPFILSVLFGPAIVGQGIFAVYFARNAGANGSETQ